MNRRTLLKLAGAGVAVWTTNIISRAVKIGDAIAQTRGTYQLAAVKNGSPDRLFDEGIRALGGMTAFVKKGQTVLIKPNCSQPMSPEYGSNTNPLVVKRIIEHAKDAGASKIYVFDHSLEDTDVCYQRSGLTNVCRQTGALVVPADDEKYYHVKKISGAKVLTETAFHEVFLESDVVINVPVLKHHFATHLTMGLKNLMGVVWDRYHFHSANLEQCIADLACFRKPDLTVVDAYYMLTGNGPRGGDLSLVKTMKTQLLSRDIVAADTAAAKIFGMDPAAIRHLTIAEQMKIGTMNLKDMSIARISL
ncbi:MAG TPA: DUF362 domain-containing protein [Spirochaetota bacterium]